jgi:hypothetical protein
MLIKEIKSVFAIWTEEALVHAGIQFKESFEPPLDPHYDYRFIYQASFDPAALDKASIEFWVSETGYVAIGVESYERIRRRTGLKAIRGGIATGHEPRIVDGEGLHILFDAVTQGKVFIVVKSFLKIITSVHLRTQASGHGAAALSGYPFDWVSPMVDPAQDLSAPFGDVLRYQPW